MDKVQNCDSYMNVVTNLQIVLTCWLRSGDVKWLL
jgi:hypothetical protein